MNKSRTIFIGDVHGCFDEFILLLEKLNIQENDKVYLTGDLIGKGPKELELIQFLIKNKKQFKSVMGNGELYLKLISENKTLNDKVLHGIMTENYKIYENYPLLFEYIINLPGIIEEKDFILVHAGLGNNNNGNTKDIDISILTDSNWREKSYFNWYKTYTGEKKVIYGHNSSLGINIQKNTIGIDSGCANGGYLTAYILETGYIIQQKSLKKYCE